MDNQQNNITWVDESSPWQEVDKDYLDMLKKVSTLKDYRDQYTCTWEIPPRRIALIERLEQYYRETPTTLSNVLSRPYADAFKRWCDEGGYTHEEVNAVKCNFMRYER